MVLALVLVAAAAAAFALGVCSCEEKDWKKGSEAEIGKSRFGQEGRTEWEFQEKLRGI